MMLNRKDIECLKAAKDAVGCWRPWKGAYARARYLTYLGHLKRAGTTAMPPYVCYVISEQGEQAIAIAAALSSSADKGIVSVPRPNQSTEAT